MLSVEMVLRVLRELRVPLVLGVYYTLQGIWIICMGAFLCDVGSVDGKLNELLVLPT